MPARTPTDLRRRLPDLLRAGLLRGLSRWLRADLVEQACRPLAYRARRWPPAVTAWAMVAQAVGAGLSDRAVSQRVAAWLGLPLSPGSGSYAKARGRLPQSVLAGWVQQLAAQARRPVKGARGRRVLAVDSTTLQLADTPANVARYSYPPGQRPGVGFPVLKLLVLMDLSSGAPTAWVMAPWYAAEVKLLEQLLEHLEPGDILVGDRAFGSYEMLVRVRACGADLVVRQHQKRCNRQGPEHREWSEVWVRPRTVGAQWPAELTVRVLTKRLHRRWLWLNTTLGRDYRATQLLEWYHWRWRLETQFRQLKQGQRLEWLASGRPEAAEKVVTAHLVALAALCCLRQAAARTRRLSAWRLSLTAAATATLAAQALAPATARRWVVAQAAQGLLPERPGRQEPRLVKRRPKPYKVMKRPRAAYREIVAGGRA